MHANKLYKNFDQVFNNQDGLAVLGILIDVSVVDRNETYRNIWCIFKCIYWRAVVLYYVNYWLSDYPSVVSQESLDLGALNSSRTFIFFVFTVPTSRKWHLFSKHLILYISYSSMVMFTHFRSVSGGVDFLYILFLVYSPSIQTNLTVQILSQCGR